MTGSSVTMHVRLRVLTGLDFNARSSFTRAGQVAASSSGGPSALENMPPKARTNE